MYQRTEDGKVIDPPIIPSYEDSIYSAMQAADTEEIQRLTEEYEEARTDLANKRDDRERRKREDEEAHDAEIRQAVRDRDKGGTPDPLTPRGR